MAHKDDLGRAGEQRARHYLLECGYRILDHNWRCSLGEIDIVAQRGTALAFIEVKTRSSLDFGHPFEAITEPKKQRLWRLAHEWVKQHPDAARGRSLRVHAIGITGRDPWAGTLEHLEDVR
ncbi:YraN family protein [Microbacterium sp. YY-01]|uniref:YraN family protein n=1 Tax=Microbacterium sp. YY-01 TaxID=3421634 RepID=UPI003D16B006